MIFVTGGTGLIGSHLLFELVASGKKVKALKRSSSNLQQVLKIFSCYSDKPEQLFNRIEWVDGDILDYFGIEEHLSGADEVYHCAAIISFRKSQRNQMIRNNTQGTANVVNAALKNGVKKFCHISSIAALGSTRDGSEINEDTNWVPSKGESGYSHSKFFSEMEVWRGIEEGLNAVIVNPSIVLGPGDKYSGSTQLFQTVWNGLKFYTHGVMGYVDVADVAKAMILLMDDKNFDNCKNQRFLLNAENLSYREIFFAIADAMGKPRPRYYASKFILGIGWRAVALYSLFSKNAPELSRETAKSAREIKKFDGSKICRLTGFTYKPMADSIREISRLIADENSK